MVYEPKTKSSFIKGDSGIAAVMFSKDGKKVRVNLTIKQGDNETKKTIDLDRENCPANLKPGNWMVQISGQGDKMLNFRPILGNFTFRVKGFAASENEEPKPKTKDVSFEKNGKKQEYSYDYFTALLEITEGKYQGLEVPYMLRYHFQDDMLDGKMVVAYSKGGSKYTDYLKEFLNVSGAWDLGPMEYKDNVLPDLQRRILHADKRFNGTMKDGWLVSGSFLPFDEPEAVDVPFDAEETVTPTPEFQEETPVTSEFEDMDFEPEN